MSKTRLVHVLTIVMLLGAACGGASEDGAGDDAVQPEQQESTNVLDISMQDYAFQVDGEAQAGDLTLNFTNEGDELHHGIIGKLDDGKTLEDVQKVLEKGLRGPPPPWFDDAPIDLTLVSPGESAGVVLDAEEGTYVLICFMPGPKGQPHFMEGMVQSFEVAGDSAASAVEPDDQISMTEDGPEAPELPAGHSILEVTNDAKKPGEVFIVQLAEGKTLDDIDPWFQKGMKGSPPATFLGGTHSFKPGESVTLAFDLEPGDYSIVSTYGEGRDRKDTPVEFTVSG